ncbi:unnamed protein product [Sphacelaria rigidula]
MCTSTNSDTELSILCDSGANVHMTPWKQDPSNTRTIDRSCTFGNKGQLQALTLGEIPLHVNARGKVASAKATLKDVLWVPGLPCRLLSTGTIRRDGGEFMDFGRKEIYLRFRKDGPKIPIAENRGFLTLSASLQGDGKHAASAHASFANKKQRLALKEWHDPLGHIDPAATKHLEKRGLIDVTDTTVASEMRCSVCKEFKSEALRYGRRDRSPKAPGEVVHTDPEGPFHADVTGMKYFKVFVDKVSRDKHVAGLKTRDAATDATRAYIDEMASEGVAIKCISGDGAGELGQSVKFQRMLTNRVIKWRNSPPRRPQSNGIAERAIQQLMRMVRSQLVKAGRREDYWYFAAADAAFKTTGMPHEYLGDETPCETLTGKLFNYDRLRTWESECFVHQHKQQRPAAAKFHPYAKRGILVGHDRHSLCWYPPQDPTSSKRSSSDSGLRGSTRLAQRRQGENTQKSSESSDGSSSDDGNFLAALLQNQDEHEHAFCMLGLVGEIATGPQEPSTTTEALAGPDADRWKAAMED